MHIIKHNLKVCPSLNKKGNKKGLSPLFINRQGLSLHVLFVKTPTNVFVCTCCEFFLTLSLKNSEILCFNQGLSPNFTKNVSV